MEATTERITADQFFELIAAGEIPDNRAELVDGLVVVNQPTPMHALLQAAIASALRNWTLAGASRGLAAATTGVLMDEHNSFGPDVIWIAEEHRPRDLRQRLERVPDLCIEVRSPTTWRYDIGAKKRVYESGGLPELWLVDDVSERVYGFRRSAPGLDHFDVAFELGRDETLTSPQLPGFRLSLDELFSL